MRLRFKLAGPSLLLLASACAAPTDEQSASSAQQTALGGQAEGSKESASALNPAVIQGAQTLPVAPLASPAAARKPAARPLVVHRSRKDPDAKRHPTGRQDATAQQLDQYKKSVPKVVGVRPTQLLLDRLRGAEGQTGLSESKTRHLKSLEAEVVPFGSDIVTAPEAPEARATSLAVTALPRTVDNSTSPAFPEIRDQGLLNSCVAFAVGYYQYTYALGKLLNWNNKNSINSTKVSPKWLYNLANGGWDGGTGPGTVHDILSTYGALTWSEYPYVGDNSNPVNYLAWPTSANQWRSALRYQSKGYASVVSPTEPGGLDQIKSLLANGQVLTFSTFIYSWEYEQVDNDPASTADDAWVGQQIATWQSGWEGGHEATIVGYSDDIWVDMNANGRVESSEKGAFKIANSWGVGWKNSGFAWVAYDALLEDSSVPNGPSSDGRNPLMGGIIALAGANTNYQPKLLAEFTVSTASRGELSLSLQQTEVDRTEAIDDYRPIMFAGGGNVAFDGTETSQPKSATFVLDLSRAAFSYGDVKYRVRGENFGLTPSTISNFSLTDRLRNNLRTVSTDPAVTINTNEVKSQSVRYKFQDPSRVPQIAITEGSSIAFGSVPLGQTAQRQITVRNTGTGDLAVSSLRFSNPLFLTKGPAAHRIVPGESRVLDLEFAPAAGQTESGTLSLRNTSTNLPSPQFTLSGAATSTNDSAPYQVFITQQNGATDNSVAFRAELKSRVTTATALSNYQVVYYLSDPGIDPASLQWENFYSNIGTIQASIKRVFLAKELGPRKADLAVTFRFPAGATLAPGASAIFEGTLRRVDYGWYPNENDDWSRFLRRGGMAEGTIVQQISSKSVLFGLPGEGQAGAYQLNVAVNPATAIATATFSVSNQSETERSFGLYIFNQRGETAYFSRVWVPSVGTQTSEFDTSGFAPGAYTAVIQQTSERLDAFTFTK